jgi:CelD/BcsL family acetyltransferase involved in cellulose biosynthesis
MTIEALTDQAHLLTLEGGAAAAIASARRAALSERYAADAFAVEWRDFAALEPATNEWRALAAGALERNVFYEPAFALAAAPAFGRGAGAFLVWSGSAPRRLLGFFPARTQTRRYGFKLPVLLGWTHAYAPLCVPLVEREAAEPVIAAWLTHIAAHAQLPGLLLLPFLPAEGPFAAALDTVLRRAQMPMADFNRHRRALLAPGGSERSHYVERALGARRHKELRRLGRRLADLGAVLFTSATEPASVAAAIKDFFVVEASGWKGRAGTAAAGHEELRRFIRAAARSLAGEGQISVNRILLDGRAIAAAIILRSGASAWFWKIAYDEAFARFSPGVMLTAALTEALADDATIARTDSCATANHPMIDHLWRERLSLCDRLIAVRPQAPFAPARVLEALRSAAITGAKTIRRRFRR